MANDKRQEDLADQHEPEVCIADARAAIRGMNTATLEALMDYLITMDDLVPMAKDEMRSRGYKVN